MNTLTLAGILWFCFSAIFIFVFSRIKAIQKENDKNCAAAEKIQEALQKCREQLDILEAHYDRPENRKGNWIAEETHKRNKLVATIVNKYET